MAEHDCRQHLNHREHERTETHGLDCGPYEHGRDEWRECAICGERFTGKELDALAAKETMTYDRQESAIDATGNAEREAERADHAGLSGDEDRESYSDLPAQLWRLPVGWAIFLPDGMVAERTGRYSWGFWPGDFQEAV